MFALLVVSFQAIKFISNYFGIFSVVMECNPYYKIVLVGNSVTLYDVSALSVGTDIFVTERTA
jgi:hypothetical protein